jgi:hypothetical protein
MLFDLLMLFDLARSGPSSIVISKRANYHAAVTGALKLEPDDGALVKLALDYSPGHQHQPRSSARLLVPATRSSVVPPAVEQGGELEMLDR